MTGEPIRFRGALMLLVCLLAVALVVWHAMRPEPGDSDAPPPEVLSGGTRGSTEGNAAPSSPQLGGRSAPKSAPSLDDSASVIGATSVLHGFVLSANGRPIQGAVVRTARDACAVDASGAFSVLAGPSDQYLRASAEGFSSSRLLLEFDGSSRTLDVGEIRLAGISSRQVRILTHRGSPAAKHEVAWVTLSAEQSGDRLSGFSISGVDRSITDAEGIVVLSGLPRNRPLAITVRSEGDGIWVFPRRISESDGPSELVLTDSAAVVFRRRGDASVPANGVLHYELGIVIKQRHFARDVLWLETFAMRPLEARTFRLGEGSYVVRPAAGESGRALASFSIPGTEEVDLPGFVRGKLRLHVHAPDGSSVSRFRYWFDSPNRLKSRRNAEIRVLYCLMSGTMSTIAAPLLNWESVAHGEPERMALLVWAEGYELFQTELVPKATTTDVSVELQPGYTIRGTISGLKAPVEVVVLPERAFPAAARGSSFRPLSTAVSWDGTFELGVPIPGRYVVATRAHGRVLAYMGTVEIRDSGIYEWKGEMPSDRSIVLNDADDLGDVVAGVVGRAPPPLRARGQEQCLRSLVLEGVPRHGDLVFPVGPAEALVVGPRDVLSLARRFGLDPQGIERSLPLVYVSYPLDRDAEMRLDMPPVGRRPIRCSLAWSGPEARGELVYGLCPVTSDAIDVSALSWKVLRATSGLHSEWFGDHDLRVVVGSRLSPGSPIRCVGGVLPLATVTLTRAQWSRDAPVALPLPGSLDIAEAKLSEGTHWFSMDRGPLIFGFRIKITKSEGGILKLLRGTYEVKAESKHGKQPAMLTAD